MTFPSRRMMLGAMFATPFAARAAGRLLPAASLAALERRIGGRVGVCALDTGTGARIVYRETERFVMCSTFKWLLAAAVLQRAASGGPGLDSSVPIRADAIVSHSDATKPFVGRSMTLQSLCAAMMATSDNGAANTLMRAIGGPAALTRAVRTWGDPLTRQDTYELGPDARPGDLRNTTTPAQMLADMQHVWLGDALDPASRAQLIAWLRSCVVGQHRLRTGVPEQWVEGDRTGTGDPGSINDLAIFWPSGVDGKRAPVLVASFLSGSQQSAVRLEAAQGEIGRIVADTFA